MTRRTLRNFHLPLMLSSCLVLPLLFSPLILACTSVPSAPFSSVPGPLPIIPPGSRWQPNIGDSWQWQIDGCPVDYSVPALIYDVDPDNSPANITLLHNLGKRVICYVNVGSLEQGSGGSRNDASQFTPADKGNKMSGWNEVYVNIRSANVRNVMATRFQAMKSLGCDGIEPDNMDSWTADQGGSGTGFSLTAADGYSYAQWISNTVHALDMAVGMKNNDGLLAVYPTAVNLFDFAIVESCQTYTECDQYSPFIDAGKPVFAAEYTTDITNAGGCSPLNKNSVAAICAYVDKYNFETIIKDCNLGWSVTFCQKYDPNTLSRGSSGSSPPPPVSSTKPATTATHATTATSSTSVGGKGSTSTSIFSSGSTHTTFATSSGATSTTTIHTTVVTPLISSSSMTTTSPTHTHTRHRNHGWFVAGRRHRHH